MKRSIVIELDGDHSPEETLREVLRLIQDGYTSGYEPTWAIESSHED